MNESIQRFRHYRAGLVIRMFFMIFSLGASVAAYFIFANLKFPSLSKELSTVFSYLWAPPLVVLLVLLPIDIYQRARGAEKILFSKCDIDCYTRIKAGVYDKFSVLGQMIHRMQVTLRIDFFSGNYLRVAETPKRISLVRLHNMPEFLMYYAFAAYMKEDRAGVDCANTYIIDHAYYHHNHRRPNTLYQVAFAVTRFAACMVDENYDGASRVFQGIKIPKSYKALDVLVRFCRARAEEAQGHVKAARGLYANVGRNAEGLYLGKNAEFLRTQLVNIPEGTVVNAKNLVSDAEIQAKKKEKEKNNSKLIPPSTNE